MPAFTYVKEIAAIVGQNIAMSEGAEIYVSYIMTRHWHHIINSRSSWNSVILVPGQGREELDFWMDNKRALNGALFWLVSFVPAKVLFSDASSTGAVLLFKEPI